MRKRRRVRTSLEQLRRVEIIELTPADQERFAAALLAPVITPAMERAAAIHRDLIECCDSPASSDDGRPV